MGKKAAVTAVINAETRQFQSKMNTVNKKLSSLGKSMKMLGGVMAGAFAVRKIAGFMAETTRLADMQLKAEAALKTALKGNEGAYATLIKQAQERQKYTLFGDEETLKAQALAQGILQNAEAVQKLAPLAQDLATAKGMQLSQAFELIAKSTASGTNALARYGIEIKGAAGSNERLESAMNAVGTAFGGQAEAAAKAGLGPLQQLNNAWGDIKEIIGGALIPIINQAAQAMSGFLTKTSKGFDNAGRNLVNLNNYFIDLYNNSMAVRTATEAIKLTYSSAFEYIKTGLKSVLIGMVGTFKIMGAALKGEFFNIRSIYEKTLEIMESTTVNGGKKIAQNFKDALASIAKKDHLSYIGIDETIIPEAQAMGAKIGTAISAGMRQSMPGAGSLGEVQSQGLQNPIQQAPDLAAVFNNVDLNPATKGADKMVKTYDNLKKITGQLSPIFQNLTNSVITGNKKMAKSSASAAKQVIHAAIAKGIASVVSGTLSKLSGPWAIPIAAAAGAAAAALFNVIVPSFATGGLAYGPTLAMVGDNPGAIRDPEVIAPLSKLQGMSPSVSLVGDWRISGDALQFVLDGYNQTMETTH